MCHKIKILDEVSEKREISGKYLYLTYPRYYTRLEVIVMDRYSFGIYYNVLEKMYSSEEVSVKKVIIK